MHTLCAGKPESDDRGNNISLKRLGTTLYRCIGCYIKAECYIKMNSVLFACINFRQFWNKWEIGNLSDSTSQ